MTPAGFDLARELLPEHRSQAAPCREGAFERNQRAMSVRSGTGGARNGSTRSISVDVVRFPVLGTRSLM